MSNPHRPVNILVVDDDPVEIYHIKTIFKRSNMIVNIDSASTGEEALDFLFKRNGFETVSTPDLVYLDMYLTPSMCGTEVLEMMQKDVDLANVHVVMLTGSVDDKHMSMAQTYGASGYVTKPLTSNKIIETMLLNKNIKIVFVHTDNVE